MWWIESGINTWDFQIWAFSSFKSGSTANHAFPGCIWTKMLSNPRSGWDYEGLSVSFFMIMRNWKVMVGFLSSFDENFKDLKVKMRWIFSMKKKRKSVKFKKWTEKVREKRFRPFYRLWLPRSVNILSWQLLKNKCGSSQILERGPLNVIWWHHIKVIWLPLDADIGGVIDFDTKKCA